jgi:hypothetical protein
MGAPTPWSGPLPELFTGSYMKKQFGTGGLYVQGQTGAGGTVIDDLVNPPASAVAAEAASLTWAQAVGSTATTSPVNGKSWYTAATVTNMVKKNFDFVMNFYLTASIARDSSGVPIF